MYSACRICAPRFIHHHPPSKEYIYSYICRRDEEFTLLLLFQRSLTDFITSHWTVNWNDYSIIARRWRWALEQNREKERRVLRPCCASQLCVRSWMATGRIYGFRVRWNEPNALQISHNFEFYYGIRICIMHVACVCIVWGRMGLDDECMLMVGGVLVNFSSRERRKLKDSVVIWIMRCLLDLFKVFRASRAHRRARNRRKSILVFMRWFMHRLYVVWLCAVGGRQQYM